ncbi:hypothetical protein VNO77_23874 [Canavalia gladiata]|uniref:Uncharacterized protein n=1 Tax=Canavalia gladiata TaxID=3824 RepID=A0AAN9L5Q0_CANGL
MTTGEAPPPVPPTGLLMKRCKFIWRLLLLSNLAFGAFLFARAKRRDSMEINRKTTHKLHKGKATVELPPESTTSSIDINYDDFFVPVIAPVEMRAPITEEQQREIFKWMLEEKRRLKPKNPEEKKQIDEEKAILKQFLHAKSIPRCLLWSPNALVLLQFIAVDDAHPAAYICATLTAEKVMFNFLKRILFTVTSCNCFTTADHEIHLELLLKINEHIYGPFSMVTHRGRINRCLYLTYGPAATFS